MEKIEVNEIEPKVEEAVEAPVEAPKKGWRDDGVIRTCETCGGELRGWAYRQPFTYCPWCGTQNK